MRLSQKSLTTKYHKVRHKAHKAHKIDIHISRFHFDPLDLGLNNKKAGNKPGFCCEKRKFSIGL
jgi:hypothetical protein